MSGMSHCHSWTLVCYMVCACYREDALSSMLITRPKIPVYAGFRVTGDHEEEQLVDHCTIETFDSMQSAEEAVRIVNAGQRFKSVGLQVLSPKLNIITH